MSLATRASLLCIRHEKSMKLFRVESGRKGDRGGRRGERKEGGVGRALGIAPVESTIGVSAVVCLINGVGFEHEPD